MAAGTPTLSLLLLVSLLSLSTTKTTIATSIQSCTGHANLVKCARDIESAFIGVGSSESGAVDKVIPLALEAIKAAKASHINILHALSSSHIECDIDNSLKAAFNIAIHELNDASKVLHGKTTLSSSELHLVQNFLNIAHSNVAKSSASLKHANSSINASLRNLINQSVNLIVLSLKIIGQLCAKVSVESTNH